MKWEPQDEGYKAPEMSGRIGRTRMYCSSHEVRLIGFAISWSLRRRRHWWEYSSDRNSEVRGER